MFLAKALAVIRSANLERVKAKSREGLIAFFYLFLATAVTVIVLEVSIDLI